MNLSYDAFHKFEIDGANGCWDAASLELKRGAGAFDYVEDTRLYTDSYTGVISAGAPLAGRRAWCHVNTTLPVHSIVDLDDTAGQTIQLRYRHSSDSNSTATAPNGFAMRNVRVDACTP